MGRAKPGSDEGNLPQALRRVPTYPLPRRTTKKTLDKPPGFVYDNCEKRCSRFSDGISNDNSKPGESRRRKAIGPYPCRKQGLLFGAGSQLPKGDRCYEAAVSLCLRFARSLYAPVPGHRALGLPVTQVIDASHTSAGYVTVSYTSTARLKVGIQYGSGKTAYRDCPSGTTSLRPGPGQRHLHRQRLPEPLRHLLPGRGQPDHARDHRQRQRPLPDLHQ